MLWMLVIVHKPCHVPHMSRITTWGTAFTKKLCSLSKEWVRSWSHDFLITYDKKFPKKVKAVRPKSGQEGEKEKEQEVRGDLDHVYLRLIVNSNQFQTSLPGKISLRFNWINSVYMGSGVVKLTSEQISLRSIWSKWNLKLRWGFHVNSQCP